MFDLFLDPIFRAPLIASILMGIVSSLIGVLLFLKKQSLITEALSHASYPGFILGCVLFSFFFSDGDCFFLSILGGGIFSLLAYLVLERLKKERIPSDAALCFVLSSFFGFGVLLYSIFQNLSNNYFNKLQVFLYGQTAMMTDKYILIYGVLASLVVIFIFAFFYQIKATYFDKEFAKGIGIKIEQVDILLFLILILNIAAGMKTFGIVLMTGMLVAPAIAARQYSDELTAVFSLAALFGALSSFLGNFFSIFASSRFSISFATGPAIVLSASIISFLSMLFAPKRGALFRMFRKFSFKNVCCQENLLKNVYKINKERIGLTEMRKYGSLFSLFLLFKKGCLSYRKSAFTLTPKGRERALQVIRRHILWEEYLLSYLGVDPKRGHINAEEMEHIISPEIENKLIDFLLKSYE